MLSGLAAVPKIVVTAKIADHEPAEKVFGAVSEAFWRLSFSLQFLLNPVKQFLVDNRRIESWEISMSSESPGLGMGYSPKSRCRPGSAVSVRVTSPGTACPCWS
jgi:hypothetical protein